MNKSHGKILWITETAVMLALLIVLQAVTKAMGQFVTGSCVNAILAVTVLLSGLGSGITVALLSPVFAYLLGIAPQLVTVPAIMVGNTVFVVLLKLLSGPELWKKVLALAVAALAKFGALYGIVVGLICHVLADGLMTQGLLKEPMIAVLTANFSWPQLVTALIGGTLALLITPVLKKALKR